jgi:hypothetical protein
VVVSALAASGADGPQWVVFGTRDGSLFLQHLTMNSPTFELSRSSRGVPRCLSSGHSEIIIGHDKGAVEIFDLDQCRMIYRAAAENSKSPNPSIVSGTIKS